MNYTLQVVKGRSDVGALRLVDGVNSIGRHDDCVIRIRSSQVSRRHCEIFEADDRLMVRDLGSSNGTYVNGKRVLGQQPLKIGDVIGIGGVSLRVDPADAAAPAVEPGADTAELEAVVDAAEVDEADDFEVALDAEAEDGFDLNLDVFPDAIPLDEPAAEPAPTPEPEPEPAPAKPVKSAKKASKPAAEEPAKEDDAVAQFLMDLKLDDD